VLTYERLAPNAAHKRLLKFKVSSGAIKNGAPVVSVGEVKG